MSSELKESCAPVLEVKVVGKKINYTVDSLKPVNLRVVDPDKGLVACTNLSPKGECRGKFPCLVNEVDLYTTVVTENNQ